MKIFIAQKICIFFIAEKVVDNTISKIEKKCKINVNKFLFA